MFSASAVLGQIFKVESCCCHVCAPTHLFSISLPLGRHRLYIVVFIHDSICLDIMHKYTVPHQEWGSKLVLVEPPLSLTCLFVKQRICAATASLESKQTTSAAWLTVAPAVGPIAIASVVVWAGKTAAWSGFEKQPACALSRVRPRVSLMMVSLR